ncbi:MAG: YncE family protein, partial [Thermoplasmataceae archaeon]
KNANMYVSNYNSNNISVINSTTNLIETSIIVGSKPVGISYDPQNENMYVTNVCSNNISVINSTTNLIETSIIVGSKPVGISYDPQNANMYVTNACSNNVSVINSTTNNVVTSIKVGRVPIRISYDSHDTYMYVTNEYSSSISIISTSLSYSTTFTEAGLPSGSTWSVTFNGTTHSSIMTNISFTLPNGKYSYTIGSVKGFSASPSSGTLTVYGSNLSQTITFTAIKASTSNFKILFEEFGLPSGSTWSVTFNGTTHSSIMTNISFTLPNGKYSYTIGSIKGFSASPSSGTLIVNGSNLSQTITFNSTATTTSNSGNFSLSSLEIYGIIGLVVAISFIGLVIVITKKRRNEGNV